VVARGRRRGHRLRRRWRHGQARACAGSGRRDGHAWVPDAPDAWNIISWSQLDPAGRMKAMKRAWLLAPDAPLFSTNYVRELIQSGKRTEARSVATRLRRETAQQPQRVHGHRAVRERLLERDPDEPVRPSGHAFLRDCGAQYILQQRLPACDVVPTGSRRRVEGEAIERDAQRALEHHRSSLEGQRASSPFRPRRWRRARQLNATSRVSSQLPHLSRANTCFTKPSARST
jgi:hypothetical protein